MPRRFTRAYRTKPPSGSASDEMAGAASASSRDGSQSVSSVAPARGAVAALKHQIQELESQAKEVRGRLEKLRSAGRAGKLKRTAKRHAVVDRLRCTGCGMCEEICPVGAIRVTYIARIDAEHCSGCGACVENCPQGAIHLA